MRHYQTGLTYVEVMVATVLIALMLVPAMEALMPGINASAFHKQRAEAQYILKDKMEYVLSESFDKLDTAATDAGSYNTATSYSDITGSFPHKVYIWRYDVDNADSDNNVFTDGEDDLLWIRIAGQNGQLAFETLRSKE